MDKAPPRTKKATPKSKPGAAAKKTVAKAKVDRRRVAEDKSVAVALQATGLGQLKPIKVSRKTSSE